ncbi:MAG: peptide deformylase 2 [Patescibacteria group bacterium]|nr:MAG: peptide deformylase 2 [Patescibacteria group bacterium]
MKKIIEIPHETLRKVAKPVTIVDKKLVSLVADLQETLHKKRNPRGVGLAAPQINTALRLFCLNVSALQSYINPRIVKTSKNKTFGPDPEDPIMEGCLSMPELYGPVPRWEWIDAEFQILENGKLVNQSARFEAFEARVFQHELDHLDGILFTDYALEFDLPVYKEYMKDKFQEVDHELLKLF